MIRLSAWLQCLVTERLESRRRDEGGVADEAALLAVLLSGAVIIAGVVMFLLAKAQGKLEGIDIPGT